MGANSRQILRTTTENMERPFWAMWGDSLRGGVTDMGERRRIALIAMDCKDCMGDAPPSVEVEKEEEELEET